MNRESNSRYLTSKLYAGPLGGELMRAYLSCSAECCERFGTLTCIDCPLVEFIPHVVPSCGATDCASCLEQKGCPCGNVSLRDELLEEIGAQVTLVSA